MSHVNTIPQAKQQVTVTNFVAFASSCGFVVMYTMPYKGYSQVVKTDTACAGGHCQGVWAMPTRAEVNASIMNAISRPGRFGTAHLWPLSCDDLLG